MRKAREYALWLVVVLSTSALFTVIGLNWRESPRCGYATGYFGHLVSAFKAGKDCPGTGTPGAAETEMERRRLDELKEGILEKVRQEAACAESPASPGSIERCQQAAGDTGQPERH